MPSTTRFRRALVAARKAAGLTQVQLAHAIEVDPITVSRWERGEAMPNRWLMPVLVARLPVLAPFGPASDSTTSKTGTEG